MQKDWDKTPERQRKSDAKAGHPGQLPSAKRMESAGETKPADVLIPPKEPQRRSPVNGTQATAIPLRPAQTAATSARRTYTDRQRQGHTGANRTCRPNAAHRDTPTARDRTPSDRERT